ncbi:hypothetical protein B0H14DRAFT_3585121 [Mycena olivaceomarginata]|nr:hypothetical protein B0H14DRAFT_3585121 [Mycena olivaceomarginata]
MRIWMEILVEIHDRKAYNSRGFIRGVRTWASTPTWSQSPSRIADTFVSTIDIEDLIYFSGIPKPLHLSNETRKHIFDLKYAKTVEEVEAFKPWISILLDPDGVLKLPIEHPARAMEYYALCGPRQTYGLELGGIGGPRKFSRTRPMRRDRSTSNSGSNTGKQYTP